MKTGCCGVIFTRAQPIFQSPSWARVGGFVSAAAKVNAADQRRNRHMLWALRHYVFFMSAAYATQPRAYRHASARRFRTANLQVTMIRGSHSVLWIGWTMLLARYVAMLLFALDAAAALGQEVA